MRIRIRLTSTVGMVVALMAATAMAVAGDPPVPGRHHDHGRFTAAVEGFPPQPVGASGVTPVRALPTTRSVMDGAAVEVALADPRVQEVLGGSFEVFTPWVADDKAPTPGAVEVTAYGHEAASTAVATVVDGVVADVGVVAAGEWQPPLNGDERDHAVSIARQTLLADGVDRVADLEGFAIHALDVDGRPFDTRMAYVTFHVDVDSRPEHIAWVDLSAGRVVRSRAEAPPQPGTGAAPAVREVRQGAPRQGHVEWEGWSFDYEVSGRVDGVSLSQVVWRGVPILARASMPAMTVFYDHPPGTAPEDTCGPYVDRLGPPVLTPVPWADDADVVLREFTQQGTRWLELGILDTLGDYVLYQSFYVGENGQLDAHTFAKGLQCEFDHLHYPFWRFDFDIAGAAGDEIVRRLPDGSTEVLDTEFDLGAAEAADHAWEVRDPDTGHRVLVGFDDGTWNVPGEVVPEELYTTNRVYGRQHDEVESGPWRTPASTELPHNDGEALEDPVLWYRGYLPHTAEEGPELWHSTGVRLDVDLVRPFYGRRGDGG